MLLLTQNKKEGYRWSRYGDFLSFGVCGMVLIGMFHSGKYNYKLDIYENLC